MNRILRRLLFKLFHLYSLIGMLNFIDEYCKHSSVKHFLMLFVAGFVLFSKDHLSQIIYCSVSRDYAY